jgi:hypothetical protein
MIDKAARHEDVYGKRGLAPCILNPCARRVLKDNAISQAL